MRKLHPTFEINGRKLVMATHLIATVPASKLGESRLNLTKHPDDIVAALDMLFRVSEQFQEKCDAIFRPELRQDKERRRPLRRLLSLPSSPARP